MMIPYTDSDLKRLFYKNIWEVYNLVIPAKLYLFINVQLCQNTLKALS